MNQTSLDFSRQARDEGIKRAAEHAGEDWMAKAVADFVRFLREHGPATCEQWRYDWLTRGNPGPASHKAYGAVASSAAKRGLIVNTGRYVKASSVKTHCHPVPIWRIA